MKLGSRFVPAQYQTDLQLDQWLLQNPTLSDESVPMDVIFVGGGPAGLCGAIELAKLVKQDQENGGDLGEIEIGVLEKGGRLGSHSLSGAVINPSSLKMLFPELSIEEFPFRGRVEKESVYMLTSNKSICIPTPPTMHNQGNYVASLCEVVRWLGEKAEGLGVNLLTSFPAESLLIQDQAVIGVRTTPAGLNRNGQPGSQYMAPTDILGKITVLTEGTRGPLTQAYLKWQKIEPPSPQIYALGVKEIWKVKTPIQKVIHTLGWPLPTDAFGGSFMYPMGEDLLALGLVVGLDYRQSSLDVHQLLQALKKHPLIASVLHKGELVEWGAKTIPEGGFYSLPQRLHGNGLMMAGDCVGLVNVPALKGIHYAMLSGIYSARAAFAALKAKDTTATTLSQYDQSIKSSPIYQDLYKVRNMRQAFKSGFYWGGMKAALMTASGGLFGSHSGHKEGDGEEWKVLSDKSEEIAGDLRKVDAVYLSGNKTRDDIPSHLKIGKDIPPEIADFYSHICPAGVYERKGDQLIVNAPNCIDCKATDVLGPRWSPREGGSGPDYNLM